MRMICNRCKTKQAVFQVMDPSSQEGAPSWLCVSCIKELQIQPFANMFDKMGITDEDIRNVNEQLLEMLNIEDLENSGFQLGGAAIFPVKNTEWLQENADSEDSAAASSGEQPARTGKALSGRGERREKKKKRKFLDSHCINLTQRAKDGELDSVIGRENEIHRVIQILCRRSKNNPCLIGEPGVGKTAIAEGLAIRIAEQQVPARLKDKELHLLDLASLVAGTQFRGQFESRIKGLVEEVRSDGNVILFIDEVHNLVGAGEAEGSMNAANILKPALSRGEIQIIGATTFQEYRRHIEKDAALERRFQPVTVEEPSIDNAYRMLLGVKSYYEIYHGVTISDTLVRRAVTLSERYIHDRFLPDKAIDLLDEACTSANLRNKVANELVDLSRRVRELEMEEEELMLEEQIDYEALANLRSELVLLQNRSESLEKQDKDNGVTEDDLAKVIQLWTGIPAAKIKEDDLHRLQNLEEHLGQKVIGQEEAVALVAAAVRRSRVQISPYRHPASFIFVGPTGVGKTELVKQIASQLFDTPETLIRLDMSEFMEKHSVSRIIGSPPGYVGYDEAGQLTEKVRRKPYSVILFDEIEKAHPDVLNILLQILDEGRVTDAHGRSVSFENTVIVMTSNAGSEKKEGALGFAKTAANASKEKSMKALSEFLRPEFLGRVDEIVVFQPLTESNYVNIAKLILNEYVSPLHDKGITLTWSDEVLSLLARRSYGGSRGARDLRNLIRREVEDRITTIIIETDGAVSYVELSPDETGEKVLVQAR